MARIKYDVRDIEDIEETREAPPGLYRVRVTESELTESKSAKQRGEDVEQIALAMEIVSTADGKKPEDNFWPLRAWPQPPYNGQHKFTAARFKEFVLAFALKSSGTLDTDKLVGKEALVRVIADKDDNGDYRARVGKLIPLPSSANDEPPEDDDLPSTAANLSGGSSIEPPWDEEALMDLSAAELTTEAEAWDINVSTVTAGKRTKDTKRRAVVAAILEAQEIETEGEAEAEDKDDDEPEAIENGYSDWSEEQLKAELQERGIKLRGRWSRDRAVTTLEGDDEESDEDPF